MLLLPRVCELLSNSGKSLPDDTSLEKLLDWFTGLIKVGEYRSDRHMSASLVVFNGESWAIVIFIIVCTDKSSIPSYPSKRYFVLPLHLILKH